MKSILNNIVLISLEGTTLWSGAKKLRPEDLGGVTLPPATLASLGHKKVFDPASLRVFKTLKRRAERVLTDVGVRFLGGYAIPESKADEVHESLLEIESEFLASKLTFLSEYDTKLEEWLEGAGEWAPLIRRAIEPASSVSQKMNFGFTAFKVGEAENSSAAVQGNLTRQTEGLTGQLMREIAQAARDTLDESYTGRTEVTRKALSPLKTMRSKLAGLMFLNHSEIGGLVQSIDTVMTSIPKTGPITGTVLAGIIGCLSQMADIQGYATAAVKIQAEEVGDEEAEVEETLDITTTLAVAPEPVATVEPSSVAPTPEVEVAVAPEEEIEEWTW